MNDKPLNCPFCGSGDVKVDTDPAYKYYGTAYRVKCFSCKAMSGSAVTIPLAVKAWNQRTPAKSAMGILEELEGLLMLEGNGGRHDEYINMLNDAMAELKGDAE
jgi:Lar family restriction alleviation protein